MPPDAIQDVPKKRRGKAADTTPGMVFTPKYKKIEAGLFSLTIPFNNQDGVREEDTHVIKMGDAGRPVVEHLPKNPREA